MFAERDDRIALFRPSVEPERLLCDVLKRFEAQLENEYTLCLHGELKAGLYQMQLLTRAGTFDIDSTRIELTQWPARRAIRVGPMDMDHTCYQMAVPTFSVLVDGVDWELVWAEVPSPEDMEQKRVRALWGIHIPEGGCHEIRLVVPERDRHRFRWHDVDELEICPDDRFFLPLPEALSREAVHPRLYADQDRFASLSRGTPDEFSNRLLQHLLRQAERKRDNAYLYLTTTLALAGKVTGNETLIQEAIDRVTKLCARENWGYHDTRGIMAWNNDRDTGNHMWEAAIVYDWFQDRLSEKERDLIRGKLAYHCDIAFKVTVLQKNYWYYHCVEAHGQGLWNGLAAASIALLGHDARAPMWLSWAAGNFVDASRRIPRDGIGSWLVFNYFWHIVELALLEHQLDTRLDTGSGYTGFAENIEAFLTATKTDRDLMAEAAYFLKLIIAARDQNALFQAEAMRGLEKMMTESADTVIHPLSLLVYDPAVPAQPRVEEHPEAACSQWGMAVCRGRGGSSFTFSCGSPGGLQFHGTHNGLNRSWYNITTAGSYSWCHSRRESDGKGSVTLVPQSLKGYENSTRHANLVTIDGEGLPIEGRWVGYRIPVEQIPFIEQFAYREGVAYCSANTGVGYKTDFGVKTAFRRWLFFHELELLLLFDRIETSRPHHFAAHVHSVREHWRRHANGVHIASTDGVSLAARALAAREDGQWRNESEAIPTVQTIPQWVPSYTFGINGQNYNKQNWQQQSTGTEPDIPDYQDLQFQSSRPVSDWGVITALSTDTELVRTLAIDLGKGQLQVSIGGSHRACFLDDGGDLLPGSDRPCAASVWQERLKRWTAFPPSDDR